MPSRQQDLDQRAADASNKQGLVRAGAGEPRSPAACLNSISGSPRRSTGLVTARNTDIGALINAGGGGPPMFIVSETSKLRVYVNVPQNYVAQRSSRNAGADHRAGISGTSLSGDR